MSDTENVTNKIIEVLVKELYKDVRLVIPSIFRVIKSPIKKALAKRFNNPEGLLEGLKTGSVKNNDLVVLECKPSMFGSYLRNHYLLPIIGMSSDMRLGPQFNCMVDGGFDFFAFTAQVSSHLKPVGLYPPIDDNLSQVTLFPSDAECYGFVGMMPGVNNLISSMPAIVSQDKVHLCGATSLVTGIVRVVTQAMFVEKGFPVEKYEEFRQSGDIWYLDVYSEGTEVKPIFDGVVTEMWGGLYASGHIEMEGSVQKSLLINGVMDSFKNAGYEPQYIENFAAGRDLTVYAKGMRFSLSPFSGLYSLHMDAELAINYQKSRSVFDSVCDNLLEVIIESAKINGAKVLNPKDLDFTYTNSAKSFSILESKYAEEISDPIAIAVRDWHRRKNNQ